MTALFTYGLTAWAAVGILPAALLVWLKKKPLKPETLFLVLVCTLGISYMLVIEPLSAPDDYVHRQYILTYATRMLGHEGITDLSYLITNGLTPHANTYEGMTGFLNALLTEKELMGMAEFQPVRVTYPLMYTPAILGCTLGMLLNVNRMVLYLMTAGCNLLFYSVCVYMAVRLMPRGKLALVMGALFPAVLQAASSYSPDAMINGLAFLLFAQIYRKLLGEKPTGKNMVPLLVNALLLSPAKAIYFPMILLLLFIPGLFSKVSLKIRVLIGTVIGLTTLWTLAVHLGLMEFASVTVIGEGYYTIGYILTHPLQTLSVCIRSMMPNRVLWLAETLVGSELSAFNLKPGEGMCYVMLICVLMTAAISSPEDHGQPCKMTRIWLWLVFLAVFAAAHGVMLLAWTAPGDDVINGVQGRYLIPVLPLALAALDSGRFRSAKTPEKGCLTIYLFMQLMYLLRVARITLAT